MLIIFLVVIALWIVYLVMESFAKDIENLIK